MSKKTFRVVGNHAVADWKPGELFDADLEPDHPWIIGGHVAPVKPEKKPVDESAPVAD